MRTVFRERRSCYRDDMPRQRNEDQHEKITQRILESARQQMREHGTAGLGMRSIARDLDLAPSGLYRYFENLDAIITALILDAFHALADTIEASSHSVASGDYAGRIQAVMMAYRRWALEHPVDFQLIYGNPIPGYQAPTEVTLAAARRGFKTVVQLLREAMAAGALEPPAEYQTLPASTIEHLNAVSDFEGYDVPTIVLCLATVGWTRIHGFVMLELFNNIQPIVGDPEIFYRVELQAMIRQLGFKL
jgi:AcrR family transcriptional regulator